MVHIVLLNTKIQRSVVVQLTKIPNVNFPILPTELSLHIVYILEVDQSYGDVLKRQGRRSDKWLGSSSPENEKTCKKKNRGQHKPGEAWLHIELACSHV